MTRAGTSDNTDKFEQKEKLVTFFEELAAEKMAPVEKKAAPDAMKLIVSTFAVAKNS